MRVSNILNFVFTGLFRYKLANYLVLLRGLRRMIAIALAVTRRERMLLHPEVAVLTDCLAHSQRAVHATLSVIELHDGVARCWWKGHGK